MPTLAASNLNETSLNAVSVLYTYVSMFSLLYNANRVVSSSK